MQREGEGGRESCTPQSLSAGSCYGFTLVELSIVLVIIGLIVGGILFGKTLIQQAEIRSAISRLQTFETAYLTFQTKYNCIIGDCKNATDFFGSSYYIDTHGCTHPNGVGNGNDNGVIKGYTGWVGSCWATESEQAVKSLQLSGLLPNSYYDSSAYGFKGINDSKGYLYNDDLYSQTSPATKYNAITWYQVLSGYPTIAFASISPIQMNGIDNKIDDGVANKGKLRGLDSKTIANPGSILLGSCSTSGLYNLSDDYGCRLLYYFK